MAPARSRPPVPIGSQTWVDIERDQYSTFEAGEMEMFASAASGQLEHINARVKQTLSHSKGNIWYQMFQTPIRPGPRSKTGQRPLGNTFRPPGFVEKRTSPISRAFRVGLTTELYDKFFGDNYGISLDPMDVDDELEDEKADDEESAIPNPTSLPQETEFDIQPIVQSEPVVIGSQQEQKNVQQPTVPFPVLSSAPQQSPQHEDVLQHPNLTSVVSSETGADKLSEEQLKASSHDEEDTPTEHDFSISSTHQEGGPVEHENMVSSNIQEDKPVQQDTQVTSRTQEDKQEEHYLQIFSNTRNAENMEHDPLASVQHREEKLEESHSPAALVNGEDKLVEHDLPVSSGKEEDKPKEHELPVSLDHGDDQMISDEEQELNPAHSPSVGSSPVKQVIRKSSLTFASLPAREPLATKKSIGTRISRTSHLDQPKTTGGVYVGGYAVGVTSSDAHQAEDTNMMDVEDVRPKSTKGESDHDVELATLHNKSSTQRLHDRINMLGKNQPTHQSKSVPFAAPALPQPNYPTLLKGDELHVAEVGLSNAAKEHVIRQENDDDEDWISPPSANPEAQHQTPIVEHRVDNLLEATYKKIMNEKDIGQQIPVNESKSKLQSAFLSAREVLDSAAITANSSAMSPNRSKYAELDAIVPGTSILMEAGDAGRAYVVKHRGKDHLFVSGEKLVIRPETISRRGSDPLIREYQHRYPFGEVSWEDFLDKRLYPEIANERKEKERQVAEQKKKDEEAARVAKEKKDAEARERVKVRQRESLERKLAAVTAARMKDAKEAVKPSRQSPRLQAQQAVTGTGTDKDVALTELKSVPPQPKQPKQIQRPIKAAKDAGPKPKPVSIQVNTLSQHLPAATNTLSSNTSKPAPAPTAKQLNIGTKSGTTAGQSSTIGTASKTLTSSANSKPRALLAAERKKEQEEREALRKQEQKRENERKRALQHEETQKREQQKRQEAEKKRMELPKKEQARILQKPTKDVTSNPAQQEKVQPQAHPHHSEISGGRHPSRLMQEFPKPPNHYMVNPAKPPIKRPLQPDPESDTEKDDRDVLAYDENEFKRRKTGSEMRPTMAPPVRQSNALKHGLKPSTYNQTNRSSLLKASTVHNAHLQYPAYEQARLGYPAETAKYGQNQRIPFAEAPNPPNHYAYKTPVQSKQPMVNADHTSPSSNGENITLVDIPSDMSDPEDSDEERKRKEDRPDWAATPELAGHLLSQDHKLNPDAVFGRIVTPRLEKMFPERPSHFRARSSSANWAGADRLTLEEIQMDEEARERLRAEGEWKFHAS